MTGSPNRDDRSSGVGKSGIIFVEVRGDWVMLESEGVIFASGEIAALNQPT